MFYEATWSLLLDDGRRSPKDDRNRRILCFGSKTKDTQGSGRKDPTHGSTLRLRNLHHRSIRVQNLGFHFLDPPRALGKGHSRNHCL